MPDLLEVEDSETLETVEPKFKVPVEEYPLPEPACSRDQFLKDVAQHKMEIRRDENGYRHMVFKRPNSGQYWFQLVTWPGYLAITGDMGDFVFTRTDDMFTFFRPDRWEKTKDVFYINPGYWGEKCVSRDRGGMDEYRPETFKAQVANWCADDEDLMPEQWAEIISGVISRADDGHETALRAAMDFQLEIEPDRGPGKRSRYTHYFQDFYELDCTEWTYNYLWCLYAIVWGIFHYDMEKARLGALAVEEARRPLNRLKKFLRLKR